MSEFECNKLTHEEQNVKLRSAFRDMRSQILILQKEVEDLRKSRYSVNAVALRAKDDKSYDRLMPVLHVHPSPAGLYIIIGDGR